MSEAIKPQAGAWQPVQNSGEFGWPPGWYVYRPILTPGGYSNEWMKTNGGIRPFRTEAAARAALAKCQPKPQEVKP